MGLFHVALTFPQAVIPFFTGPLIDRLNGAHGNGGYRIVFASAVVFMILGTSFVSRIKTVR
jgi:O-antigen/teichoic acid export membrane protein